MLVLRKNVDIVETFDIKHGNFLVHVWARSSAGEHCFDVAGVSGSIPLGPTMFLLRLVCLR